MNVLIFAPHRDDEVLGVGGTILKRKKGGDRISVCIVTARDGECLPESTQRIHDEMKKVHGYIGIDQYIGFPFSANKLESISRVEFNKAFEEAVKKTKPEEVYMPFWGDLQRDHKLTVDGAMIALRAKNTYAPKRIYMYETLSETGLNTPSANNAFIPNVYEDISDYIDEKLKLMEFYQSQIHDFPGLRSIEAIEALAKLRGATINAKAAEAFMLVREIK